jgi:hypothetical protein
MDDNETRELSLKVRDLGMRVHRLERSVRDLTAAIWFIFAMWAAYALGVWWRG